MCSFRGSFVNRGNGTELYSSDVVPVAGLEHSLRLAQGAALEPHWAPFTTAPGSTPAMINIKNKDRPKAVLVFVSALTKRYVPLLLHVYTRFFFTFSFCARVFTITLGHSTRLYTI